ncbi:MAG: hypothetical protein OEU50_15340, partial [Gammaproteobacteria bacterium]|nr:hypothetical protein [Gammaproteobacteria bacterium]
SSAATRIARLNADGSIDIAFATGTGFNGMVRTIAITNDGSGDIYVGGDFTTYNGSTANRLVRLNADGSLDAAFATGTGFNGAAQAIAPATDGSGDVYVGGGFGAYNGSAAMSLVRLNADGSIDAAFATGTGFDSQVNALALAAGGDVYVGGQFITYNGSTANRLVRLNADGSVDAGFVTGTGFDNNVHAITMSSVLPGDIYVGGFFTSYDGSAANRVVRLNADGSIDAGFATGTGFDIVVATIVPAFDLSGDIYVGGNFQFYNGNRIDHLVLLNVDGSIDAGFATGTGVVGTVNAIAAATDGSGAIHIGGGFITYNGNGVNNLARLNIDGSIDADFNAGTGFNGQVNAIAAAYDASIDIYVGGSFSAYNGTTARRFARLDAGGNMDPAFVTGIGFDSAVRAVASATDGSGDVYVGGEFTTYDGNTANRLVRLNADGSIDVGFGGGLGFNVWAIAATTDGSGDIYVGGQFANRLVRLDADGSVDAGFITGSGFNGTVFAIAVASDGSGDVYVGGHFTSYNGIMVNRLVRLNADGSIDAAFASGTGFPTIVRTIVASSDGDVYVGGQFTTYNGSMANRLVRLNADGSIDTAFATGTGFNSDVYAVAAANDRSGDVYVGGFFRTYNDSTVNRLVRLNANGSIDTAFATGTSFNNTVLAIAAAIDLSGDAFVGGDFTSYDTTTVGRIVRLDRDGTVD